MLPNDDRLIGSNERSIGERPTRKLSETPPARPREETQTPTVKRLEGVPSRPLAAQRPVIARAETPAQPNTMAEGFPQRVFRIIEMPAPTDLPLTTGGPGTMPVNPQPPLRAVTPSRAGMFGIVLAAVGALLLVVVLLIVLTHH